MIVLTSTSSGTYKAQIRSSREKGFKQIYVGTSTESERSAARNLVRKWYGDAAAETLTSVKDGTEIAMLIGDFNKDPKRKQVFEVFTFNPAAKAARKVDDALIPPSQKPAKEVAVTVVPTKEVILSDSAKALEKLRVVIVKHEETFAANTLGPRLQIGLACLKAHHVFTIKDPKKTGAMKGKKAVTRDGLNTEGFEGWLISQAQWLKKPTAYKYMTAVRGLGLDHDATAKQVAHSLKLLLRKGPVTIKSLCDLALDPIGPGDDKGESDTQTEFAFLKDNLSHFREEVENLCKMKEKLTAYPDFHRAATARLYSALHELTGTHWAPSDEPDSLALVDPDAIKI